MAPRDMIMEHFLDIMRLCLFVSFIFSQFPVNLYYSNGWKMCSIRAMDGRFAQVLVVRMVRIAKSPWKLSHRDIY